MNMVAPLERGEVHRLSDSNSPARLACQKIVQDQEIDRPKAECMGVWGAQDSD